MNGSLNCGRSCFDSAALRSTRTALQRSCIDLLACFAFCALAGGSANAVELKLSLENIETRDLAAKAVTATVTDKSFRLAIGELSFLGRTWREVGVACASFRVESDMIECRDGTADAGGRMSVSFSYRPGSRSLDLTVSPRAKETWRVRAGFAEGARRMELTVENASLAALASLLPEGLPKTSAGTLNANLVVEGAERPRASGAIEARGAGFSDASGLRAGEKLDADLRFTARDAGTGWSWQATLEWKGGEVFWQPLYLRAGGDTVRAEGTFDERKISVARSVVTLPGVGEIEGGGEWESRAGRLQSADVRSGKLDASALYARVLQPHFSGTALSDLRVAGSLELSSLRIRDAELEALEVAVHDVSFEDSRRRFAVFGANGRIPWHRTEVTHLDLEIKGGEALTIPVGAVKLPLTMRGMRFRLENVEIPVLDGRLAMKGFATDPPGDEDWRWNFSGAVTPVSMERLSQAFGWPVMHGVFSAEIPKVAYAKSTLQVGGALVFKIFDGTVTMRNLTLSEPFGRAPRLTADLDMRNLDLDLLTRTFSFGSITGRIDAAVEGLELVNWQPVKFDARLASSPGDYPRKISQAAVQNITALGGAGASAAIERTFLRFFEQFGYEKLGVSCRLEHDVCRMGGVENASAGYLIVKGSGVPALSVMGYNRAVNWSDLVERVKRIAQQNVHAVVR